LKAPEPPRGPVGLEPPPRKLPALTPETEAFWTGGKDGLLLIQRCSDCGHYQHPPLPLCPICRTETMAPSPVSGRGTVKTFTVNHQNWLPGLSKHFVFAAVELPEQGELYVFSNVLAPPEAVRIGMPVSVCFEHQEDVWLPLFQPENNDAG
jgi:uncharacterized OB-fold protein